MSVWYGGRHTLFSKMVQKRPRILQMGTKWPAQTSSIQNRRNSSWCKYLFGFMFKGGEISKNILYLACPILKQMNQILNVGFKESTETYMSWLLLFSSQLKTSRVDSGPNWKYLLIFSYLYVFIHSKFSLKRFNHI